MTSDNPLRYSRFRCFAALSLLTVRDPTRLADLEEFAED